MKRETITFNRRYASLFTSSKTVLSVNMVLALLLILVLIEGRVEADIYKYQDQNGNWVLTDSPPDHVENIQTVKDRDGRSSRSFGFRDIENDLTGKYHPKNAIEMASLSTVTIKTSIGTGSGFFINDNGYILTNKHVLKGDESQLKEMEKSIAKIDERIEREEADIADAENQLRRMKKDLDDYKAYIDRMTDPNAQKLAVQKFKNQSEQYDYYEAQLMKRKSEFEEQTSKYRQQKGEFTRKTRMAKYDRQFVVILKDKTELEADLVSVSEEQDLALVKIEGCKSPYIQPSAQKEIIQGMNVFAIGSPVGMRDSVSSGIISGYDDEYIRTDAKIYPGNSGGPLITADGKVIGINTLKLITRKFEGIGFAIPVKKAFQEFSRYLGDSPQGR